MNNKLNAKERHQAALKQETQGQALPREQAAARVAALWTMLGEGVTVVEIGGADARI